MLSHRQTTSGLCFSNRVGRKYFVVSVEKKRKIKEKDSTIGIGMNKLHHWPATVIPEVHLRCRDLVCRIDLEHSAFVITW